MSEQDTPIGKYFENNKNIKPIFSVYLTWSDGQSRANNDADLPSSENDDLDNSQITFGGILPDVVDKKFSHKKGRSNATFFYAKVLEFEGINACNGEVYTGYGYWAVNQPKVRLGIVFYALLVLHQTHNPKGVLASLILEPLSLAFHKCFGKIL